jgi:hypothetical protein
VASSREAVRNLGGSRKQPRWLTVRLSLDHRFQETCHMGGIQPSFQSPILAIWRRAIELSLGETDLEKLRMITRSRTEPASRVERARILLGYWEKECGGALVRKALRRAQGKKHRSLKGNVSRLLALAEPRANDPKCGRVRGLMFGGYR